MIAVRDDCDFKKSKDDIPLICRELLPWPLFVKAFFFEVFEI